MKIKPPKIKRDKVKKDENIIKPEDMTAKELVELARKAKIHQAAEEALGEEDEEKKKVAGLLIRRRALIKAAKRISRAKKLTLLLGALAILLLLIFSIAVTQEKMGNFTINLNRLEMYRQGIMLADNEDFKKPTSRLKAAAVENASNISINDLPADIDMIDGEHNGIDYMAYTFYIRNGGRETVDYYYNIIIEMEAKGVSEAVRVAIYDKDGNRQVYGKRARDGTAEYGTIPFVSSTVVMENYLRNFEVNQVEKYTVVIWLEGDDPECVDAIIGGMIRFSMNFEIADPIDDNTRTDHIIKEL